MSRILLHLILLFPLFVSSQSKYPEYRNIRCDSLMKFDTVKVDKKQYPYKIVSLYFEVKTDTIYVGEIILPDFKPDSNKNDLIKVLTVIGEKEKFSAFEVYPSCESLTIQISSSGYNWKKRTENSKKIIGKVMLNE